MSENNNPEAPLDTILMDECARKRHRGPKPKASQPGTRVSLGLKVTPATKVKLIRVSTESGRTMSQEAERLIELGMMFDVMISLGRERLWETCISAAAMGS